MFANKLAEKLLEIQAVKLQPSQPFTWASGLKSPIYCDNRLTLSFPDIRNLIKNQFVYLIEEFYPTVDCIAGVATAGIPHATLLADVLNLPLVYARPNPKQHGLKNSIEGHLKAGSNIVVVEDLISTGMSSMSAIEILKEGGGNIMGLLSVFTYEMEKSKTLFENAQIETHSLTNYSTLIEEAVTMDYVAGEALDSLRKWRDDPDGWG